MRTTEDRYREAGMPLPNDTNSPLPIERVHVPALDGPVLPEIDPAIYGPDSVPLDSSDADPEEIS